MNRAGWGRRRFSLGLGAAVALPGLVRAQSGAGRIVLGQSAALTGPAAQLGLQFSAGANLFFAQLNALGGVEGQHLEVQTLDDGYEPVRCAENTKQLIADKKVFALFGYIGTPTSLAALPLFTQAKVPFFGPFTGAQALRQPFNRLIFHVRASYYEETALIVQHLTSLGMKKIAVFYQNDSYGKAGLDGVTRALATIGLAPVATATVERNTTEVDAAVASLLAAEPNAVVQITAYASAAAFVRAARNAGFGGLFYNVSFVGTQALADTLGKDGAGVVVSQVMPSPYRTAHPLTRDFHGAIARGGSHVQPNYSSLEGYLAARVFARGLRQTLAGGGKLTRENFIAGTEALGQQMISGFSVTFGAQRHEASRFIELSMLTGTGTVLT